MGQHWTSCDGEWYAFGPDADPRFDDPTWVVKLTPDDTWAGWEIFDDGERNCITHDHDTAAGARAEVDEATRPVPVESHHDRAVRMCAEHYEWEARTRKES